MLLRTDRAADMFPTRHADANSVKPRRTLTSREDRHRFLESYHVIYYCLPLSGEQGLHAEHRLIEFLLLLTLTLTLDRLLTLTLGLLLKGEQLGISRDRSNALRRLRRLRRLLVRVRVGSQGYD